MTSLEIGLLVTSISLLTLLIATIVYVIKFARIILRVQDQVEESLDMLNDYYGRIAHIANTPVLIDEPYVREILGLIRGLRDAVLLIASKLVSFAKQEEKK